MNHLNAAQRYRDYRPAIQDLLSTTSASLADEWRHCVDHQLRLESLAGIASKFPFISAVYILDEAGKQMGDTLLSPNVRGYSTSGAGADRSSRPYFDQLRSSSETLVTTPYLSINNQAMCVSAMAQMAGDKKNSGSYLVLDVDLKQLLSFLMGDGRLHRVEPLFKAVYLLISVALFLVVGILLWQAGSQLIPVLSDASHQDNHQVFGVVIYLTLALAIFDLGKTTLEEEVLLGKDVFRHSSTRRTITRFMAAILIAISIESLMLIFKSALSGDTAQLTAATWVMVPAVGLLIGLGIYVYLGAQAEKILLETNRQT